MRKLLMSLVGTMVIISSSFTGASAAAFTETLLPGVTDTEKPVGAYDDQGKLYSVWSDGRDTYPNNTDVYFATSMDNGKNWSASQLISTDPYNTYQTSLSMDTCGDKVAVAWRTPSNGVYTNISNDRGATWGQPVKVTPITLVESEPQIRFDDMYCYLHIAFSAKYVGKFNIAYSFSSTGGGWTTPTFLTQSNTRDYYASDLEFDGQNGLHLTYVSPSLPNEGNYNQAVFYQYSPFGGTSWNTPITVVPFSDYGGEPELVAGRLSTDSEDKIYISWAGTENNPQDSTRIYLAGKTLSAKNFEPRTQVSNNLYTVAEPEPHIENGVMTIGWSQDWYAETGPRKLMLGKSINGASWSRYTVRLNSIFLGTHLRRNGQSTLLYSGSDSNGFANAYSVVGSF